MTEAKKIHNREMHEIRSFNDSSNRINKDQIDRIKRAKDIIQDLKRHGPVGLIHIAVLSNIIEKPIQIWNADGSLNRIIGEKKTGEPIDIEYHTTDSEQIGHWTLKYGKDPDNISIDLNSCLFSVVGSQIGRNPSKLRKWTEIKLKSNFRKLLNQMDKILRLGKNGEIILMIGGARYCGTSPSHAGLILDRSQNQQFHGGEDRTGHPRGHASHPFKYGIERFCVEEAIKKQRRQTPGKKVLPEGKSGFLSRADQDYVTHLALKTRKAQDKINDLNAGDDGATVEVFAEDLTNSKNKNSLPKVGQWNDEGKKIKEADLHSVKLVLRHHKGQKENKDADVFVLTCYPILKRPLKSHLKKN